MCPPASKPSQTNASTPACIAFNANYQVFSPTGEMREGKPLQEWQGGTTRGVETQFNYWDKTKVKGETK